MRVEALSGLYCATDYMRRSRERMEKAEDKHPTGAFKQLLDRKMTELRGDQTCGKSLENLTARTR